MRKDETASVKHCGYCSEGYDGKCDGVHCDISEGGGKSGLASSPVDTGTSPSVRSEEMEKLIRRVRNMGAGGFTTRGEINEILYYIRSLQARNKELEEQNAQLLADWRRMKEVLEIAEPYIVDPDEWMGVNSMTLEYRSPLSKEQKLHKEIESVRKTKADKKKVNDVLRSLSYIDSPSQQ